MNLIDIVLIAAVAGACILAAYKWISNIRKGKTCGCCGGDSCEKCGKR